MDPTNTTHPTLADRMRALDEQLMATVAAAQAAHSEARDLHMARATAGDDVGMTTAWHSVQFLGGILGELTTIRGRL